MTSNSISIPILICNQCEKDVETLALIDSGAGGMFIDRQYAEEKGFCIEKLEKPITARNVDGTRNKLGTITSYVELPLKINGRTRRTRLLVTGLGNQRVILGFPWLNEQNLDINWKTGEFKWRPRKLVIKRWGDSTKTANPMKEAKNVVKQMLNQLEKERTAI